MHVFLSGASPRLLPVRLLERIPQGVTKLCEARPVVRGHADGRRIGGQLAAYRREALAHLRQVELGDHQAHRPFEQLGIVQAKLLEDGAPLGDRIVRAAVDDAQEGPRAFDVPQECVSETVADMGARDETRHVGDQRGARIRLRLVARDEDAQVRGGGGERIGPDARSCLGERGEQRGLAGVGRAHQPDVGDRLELELDPALLARVPLLVMARGSVRGRHEVDVAAPAAPAASHHQAILSFEQLPERLAGLGPHHRSGWHTQDQVGAVSAVRPTPASTSATPSTSPKYKWAGGESTDGRNPRAMP